MRQKYRMFLRGSVYWTQDNETGKKDSLRTKDRSEAKRLLHAKNEACRQPIINMQIARAYLLVSGLCLPRAIAIGLQEAVQWHRVVRLARQLAGTAENASTTFQTISISPARNFGPLSFFCPGFGLTMFPVTTQSAMPSTKGERTSTEA